jgi:hypothetical protein
MHLLGITFLEVSPIRSLQRVLKKVGAMWIQQHLHSVPMHVGTGWSSDMSAAGLHWHTVGETRCSKRAGLHTSTLKVRRGCLSSCFKKALKFSNALRILGYGATIVSNIVHFWKRGFEGDVLYRNWWLGSS